MSLGLNVPQMTQAKMRKVKLGLADLFKTEINPIMREFKSSSGDWEDWHLFEGAYEEALHFLRLHVMNILKHDENRMSRLKKVNPRMQKAQAEQREEPFTKQSIQRRRLKLKSELERCEECQKESLARERKQLKIVAELD
jgi:hypothetical protein